MAYESLERYRKAYVDYKTVLQIDMSVQAAHDSVNRYWPSKIQLRGCGEQADVSTELQNWLSFKIYIYVFD